MTASATPTKNDPKSLFDVIELTEAAVSLYTGPSAGTDRGTRLTTARFTNTSNFPGRVDLYLVPNGGSPSAANALCYGYPVPAGGYPAIVPLGGEIMEPGATLQALCYAAKGWVKTNQFSASEAASAVAGTQTYTATTVLDSAASVNRTAGTANGDDVGKRIYVAGGVFGIITSNTGGAGTSTLTCSAGWREVVGGVERAADTPVANTTFKISASLRDIGETPTVAAVAANSFLRGLITCGGVTGRVVGNNTGIATFGTTYQIAEGGWSNGTNPGNTVKWDVAPSIFIAASGIEMAT